MRIKLFIIPLMLIMSAFVCKGQEEFIDLYGDSITVEDKNCILITYSLQSCRQCYKELNVFLERTGYNDDYKVYIIGLDTERNISDAGIRKTIYVDAKKFLKNFDDIFFFPTDKEKGKLYQTKPAIGIPTVYFIKAGKVKSYDYEEFMEIRP